MGSSVLKPRVAFSRRGKGMKTPAVFLAFILAASAGWTATPPVGFEDTVLFNASEPTALAYEPGSGNAFVLEKGDGSGGARVRRRALAGGAVSTALTLTCVDASGERGLLGIAFDPDYLQGASTRWVYLYYTRQSPASGACSIPGSTGSRNRVVRFKEAGGVLSGEVLLLEGPILTGATNHNGGTLRFAPDKTLFVSVGDNDTDATANPLSRDLSDLRGKILRIARDGTVPSDNPFVAQAGARGEIWAWGLRNPFRFSIDASTGTPWIADVGENTFEEIDRGVKGADYGYPCFEGNAPFRACNPVPANPTAPAFVYGHTAGTVPFSGSTVIGGPVYRNGNFSASYEGRLFFADFIEGWVRTAAVGPGGTLSDVQLFMADAGNVADLVQAPNGCLGFVDFGSGSVHETCHTTDQDGDGVLGVADGGTDCNDLDSTVYPGAPELCDETDNDCNLAVDEATCAAFGGSDGAVNGFDLALLGRYFGQCSASPASQPWAPVEFTKDGCLDGKDLAVMSAVWGCAGIAPLCP